MDRARRIIHAEEVWKRGIRGKGVTVAVLDTGTAPHPDFEGRMIGFYDFINQKKEPYDDFGHGTHVCGILCGAGNVQYSYCGIAPEAEFISLKVLDRNGNGRRKDVINGIYWTIEHQKKYRIRIMNISVGTVKEGDVMDDQLIKAVEDAWDAGIVVVVAAGNLGPDPQTITAPGNSRKVITVGSSDERRPFFSGRGPTRCCVCKPDIVAPGSDIISCSSQLGRGRPYYCRKSGTSMATPMVSGAAALLLSKEPWLTNVEVKMRLRESAVNLSLPHSRQGWGLLDVARFCRISLI